MKKIIMLALVLVMFVSFFPTQKPSADWNGYTPDMLPSVALTHTTVITNMGGGVGELGIAPQVGDGWQMNTSGNIIYIQYFRGQGFGNPEVFINNRFIAMLDESPICVGGNCVDDLAAVVLHITDGIHSMRIINTKGNNPVNLQLVYFSTEHRLFLPLVTH
jgi:hypothetical protein